MAKRGTCFNCRRPKMNLVAKELCAKCYIAGAVGRPYQSKVKDGTDGRALSIDKSDLPRNPQEPKTISHADIMLESIIKENKIKKIRIEFELEIGINNIKVTGI